MNIREHPLAWRWTDSAHAILPEHVLGQMHPIEPREAESLVQRSLHLLFRGRLAPQGFESIVQHSADIRAEIGCRWLRDQQPDLFVEVVVSWQRVAAIRTTWEIFTAHWDDFCYPSSDDVLVWPESESWALFYHHEEQLQFGRRLAV